MNGLPEKSDQRDAAIDRLAYLRHGIGDVAQFLADVGHAQRLDRSFVAQRALELRAFSVGKIQSQPHRIRHGQDIGEQDRGIERVAVYRLQRDFGGEVRVLAQAEEAAGALAGLAVFGQETAGLAHHPHRRVFGRLTQQRAQEGVVF